MAKFIRVEDESCKKLDFETTYREVETVIKTLANEN